GTSYYLGKGKLALGEAGAALPLLEQAARRAPGEAAVQYQLARALNALGRKGEAAAAFARVARLRAAANAESIVMK
ncbi:MAG: tetratricopeptide repeat protein, partial [Acidobacteriota bacterium]